MERRERSKHFLRPLCLPDNQPPKRIDHHPRLRSALKFSFSRDFPSPPYPSLEVDLSPFPAFSLDLVQRIKLIRRQSVVLRKQGNERRMGEEMGETKGKGGRGERRAVTRNSFHFPVDPSFFFYSPLQIQDHLKSTHGHVHPPPYTKSPHLFESYDIHAGYIYIYIYVYVLGTTV